MGSQIVLKVFPGVFSSQKEPETYLQHVHTTKIELFKAFCKFKKSHTILIPSNGRNDSQLTPSFYSAKWPMKWLYVYSFLKICRIFFGVQRRVWSALRSFLNSSTGHFRSLLKITCLHENMQEFLLETHLTPRDGFG